MSSAVTVAPASSATASSTVDGGRRRLLDVRGLRVSLGGHEVLAAVDVGVDGGEVVGLVGPNGAGKSTFLRAVTRMVAPSAGTIDVAGAAPDALSRRELAKRVAVVQQLPDAPPTLRVRDLVLLGRHPHLSLLGREGIEDYRIVDEAMLRAGCRQFADRELGTLSGGERRRAFIARALAQSAPLLLLDEPTSNLDARAQNEVLELVVELADAGDGVLVVLHDLTLAAAYCDRIVLLDKGVVVAAGTPDEVVTQAVVRRVYGPTVAVIAHPSTGAPLIVPTRLER